MIPKKRSAEIGPEKRDKGFTLLETIFAMAVLAITFLSLAQLMAIAVQQNSFARFNSIGIGVARGQLEELNALYHNELSTGVPAQELQTGGYGPIDVVVEAPAGSGQGDRTFEVSWTVERGRGNQAEVIVTVNPKIQNPLQNKEVSISSRFSP